MYAQQQHITTQYTDPVAVQYRARVLDNSQGEGSLDPLKKLVVEIIAFFSTLGSLETDSG